MKKFTKKHWFLALSLKMAQVTLAAVTRVSRHKATRAGAQRETTENRKKLYFPNIHGSRSRRNMETSRWRVVERSFHPFSYLFGG
jgi:hypothetical protein